MISGPDSDDNAVETMSPWKFGVYQIALSALPFMLSVKLYSVLGFPDMAASTIAAVQDSLTRLTYKHTLAVFSYLSPLAPPVSLLVASAAAAYATVTLGGQSRDRFRKVQDAYIYQNGARSLWPAAIWVTLWGWSQWPIVQNNRLASTLVWLGIAASGLYQCRTTNTRVATRVLDVAGYPEPSDKADQIASQRRRRASWRYWVGMWIAFLISWFVVGQEIWVHSWIIGGFVAKAEISVRGAVGLPVP